jgi:uncharacterized LabA/DUF88 family protein
MIGQYAKGRVAVFVDASNIYHSQKTLNWRVDFKKLFDYFSRETTLVSCHFYTGIDSGNEKQCSFLKHLEGFGLRVVSKELKIIKTGKNTERHKGSLDIELALDCYITRNTFDTLVLMSGDSDFSPLLDHLKKENKRIIVVSARGHVAVELLSRAKFVEIGKLRAFIEYKIQKAPKGL